MPPLPEPMATSVDVLHVSDSIQIAGTLVDRLPDGAVWFAEPGQNRKRWLAGEFKHVEVRRDQRSAMLQVAGLLLYGNYPEGDRHFENLFQTVQESPQADLSEQILDWSLERYPTSRRLLQLAINEDALNSLRLGEIRRIVESGSTEWTDGWKAVTAYLQTQDSEQDLRQWVQNWLQSHPTAPEPLAVIAQMDRDVTALRKLYVYHKRSDAGLSAAMLELHQGRYASAASLAQELHRTGYRPRAAEVIMGVVALKMAMMHWLGSIWIGR